jgi:hypothetical protein
MNNDKVMSNIPCNGYIKLTKLDNFEIYINIKYIVKFHKYETGKNCLGSTIYFATTYIHVRETSEEIMKKIEEIKNSSSNSNDIPKAEEKREDFGYLLGLIDKDPYNIKDIDKTNRNYYYLSMKAIGLN